MTLEMPEILRFLRHVQVVFSAKFQKNFAVL